MHDLDLLIIGAGPAGLSTALHLLKIDPSWADRLVVLEKAAHPRHKLCGGGVTAWGLQTLKDLGFQLPLPLPQAQIDDIRLLYDSRMIHVRGEPAFVVFQRAAFDAYLAIQSRRRGIQIRENETVKQLIPDDDGVTVETEAGRYRARVVVGADGSKGMTRRLVIPYDQPSRIARLLEVVHPASENAGPFLQRYATFDFSPARQDLQGYFWDFPAWVDGEPHANRGVYDSRFAPQRPRANLPGLLNQGLRTLGHDPQEVKLEGHPIHWFSPRSPLAMPRVLLVGDAAGVDPLFGEGIAPALGYGQVAAQEIQAAFAQRDFSFRTYRSNFLRSRTGRYLLLRWYVAWWSYRLSGHLWFMHALWSLGKALASTWPKPQPLYPPEEDTGKINPYAHET
jgi:flavin-dependent dehydrogenase